MARIDAAVSLFWLLFGLALCWQSMRLGLTDPGAGPGSGLFPFLAGLLIAGGGAGLILRHALSGGPAPGEEIAPAMWEASGAALRVLALLAVIAGMILAVPYTGFALSGMLGLPILYRVIAPERGWIAAILVGTVAAGLIHLLFVVALGTPLPRGPLGF
jgi:hypothetical protein